jgi:hypothetical protein
MFNRFSGLVRSRQEELVVLKNEKEKRRPRREGKREEKEEGRINSLSHQCFSMNYRVMLEISLRSPRLFIFTIESEIVYRTSPMYSVLVISVLDEPQYQ